jgi:D-alanyl-D-alanine carboxypeptidase
MGRTLRGARLCVAGVLVFASACSSGSSTSSGTPAPAEPSGTAAPGETAVSSTSGQTSPTTGTEPAAEGLFGALPTDQIDAETASALQEVVDRAVTTQNPSVIAAVVTPNGVWSGAAGVDGPDGRLATPQDEFAIASVTKMFTAALIMRLVDEGKIDLDNPLSDYLGDLGEAANGATVREALEMRSGLANAADAALAEVTANPERVWTADEVAADFPQPVAKPGVEYNYSNPTYKLLGMAAEHVTGATLAEAMRSEVLDPAGAGPTLLVQGADTPTPEPWALPTEPGAIELADYGTGGALPSISTATYSLAASGMASDAPSLAAWAWQLFAGKVVSAQSLAAMTTIGGDDYGLGVESLSGIGLPPVFGHGGVHDGYQSVLAVIPDQQDVIVVFINRTDADVSYIAGSLADVLKA